MRIQINGQITDVDCQTLSELLTQLGHDEHRVATAVNREFVPLSERAQCTLADGDTIEIIAPMAGG